MKPKYHFAIIILCIILLPLIYYLNGEENNWITLIPLSILIFYFLIGLIFSRK